MIIEKCKTHVPIRDGIVKKIQPSDIKKQADLIGSTSGEEPIENYVAIDLLKKLRVKRTKRGWIVIRPKAKAMTKKEIEKNLPLLSKYSKDGNLDMIEKVLRGDIYPSRRDENLLLQTYRVLTQDKIWNINCGDVLGKDEAMRVIVSNYRSANRSRSIYVMTPNIVKADICYKGVPNIHFIISRKELRFVNQKHKVGLAAVVFSDNVKNAHSIHGMWNIEYRGGFYGSDGRNI